MTIHTRLLLGCVYSCAALPAFAQVSATDVWNNQQAGYEALGITVSATFETTDNVLTASDIELSYALPMGLGTVRVGSPDVTLTENGDGTVTQTYPESSSFQAGFDFSIEGESGSVQITYDLMLRDYVSVASGTPEAVNYATSATLMDVRVGDIKLPSDLDLPGLLFEAFFTIQNYRSDSQISVADVVTTTTTTTSEQTIYDVTFSEDFGISGRSVGSIASTTSTATVVLPRTPLDLFNLAAAFRDGLAFDLRTDALDNQSQNIQRMNDEIVSDQRQVVDRSDQSLRLDQSGLFIGGSASGITLSVPADMAIPFPFDVTLSDAAMSLQMPISASAEPQSLGLALDLRNVVVSDELWDMADPGAAFPREPITMAFNVTGEVINEVDLFNFASYAALEPKFMTGDWPIRPQNLALDGLDIRAAGVAVTGEGAFSFDYADMDTLEGLPRPVGTGTISATGVNAMMDSLGKLGWFSSEELMGFRMGLAMVANPSGEDALTTTLEMTADGQMIVNGQRMQ